MLKLDNGTELFTARDMDRLGSAACGRIGGRGWVGKGRPASTAPAADVPAAEGRTGCPGGSCRCQGRCVRCTCLERRAAQGADTDRC